MDSQVKEGRGQREQQKEEQKRHRATSSASTSYIFHLSQSIYLLESIHIIILILTFVSSHTLKESEVHDITAVIQTALKLTHI